MLFLSFIRSTLSLISFLSLLQKEYIAIVEQVLVHFIEFTLQWRELHVLDVVLMVVHSASRVFHYQACPAHLENMMRHGRDILDEMKRERRPIRISNKNVEG